MDAAVSAGMTGATLFGLLLTPVFCVVLKKPGARKPAPMPEPDSAEPLPPAGNLPA